MPRPLLPILLHVAAASVSTFLPGTAEPATGDSVRLLEWINGSEGGFVHPTHSVRRLGPGFRGIFARQAVAEGASDDTSDACTYEEMREGAQERASDRVPIFII